MENIFRLPRIYRITRIKINRFKKYNMVFKKGGNWCSLTNEAVTYLLKNKKVIFDAEHFFDGYKENKEYSIMTLKVAMDAGASRLVLCDTNGGTLPN